MKRKKDKAATPQTSLPWDEFSVTVETVVRWRDLDSYNHINNSVYLNYFEEGRIAYLYKITELAGIKPDAANRFEGFSSTLTKMEIDFKAQGFLHDTIVIATRYTAVRKIFMEAEYAVFVKNNHRLLARGKSVQVALQGVGINFKPTRVNERFIEYARKLEGDRLVVV
jgi:acyl-CoA thioester hydrolase